MNVFSFILASVLLFGGAATVLLERYAATAFLFGGLAMVLADAICDAIKESRR